MLEINTVSKKYKANGHVFTALDAVSLNIKKGEFMAVTGKSGSGKSTLLYVIGGLIQPDTGSVLYMDRNIYNQSRSEKDAYRKKEIGFVFQQFHLMPYLSVLDNIRLACYDKNHFQHIESYLEKCSLTALRDKFPAELSVGEKQRTAFIRAIISNPKVLLADEPTGNLDPDNSRILMNLISSFHRNGGTVIMVSHNHDIVKYADRAITIDKGKIIAHSQVDVPKENDGYWVNA